MDISDLDINTTVIKRTRQRHSHMQAPLLLGKVKSAATCILKVVSAAGPATQDHCTSIEVIDKQRHVIMDHGGQYNYRKSFPQPSLLPPKKRTFRLLATLFPPFLQ